MQSLPHLKEKMTMKLSKLTLAIGCFVLCSFLFFSPASSYSDDTIEIDVAPNVLNIQSQGTVVTVHTDISYWLVDVSSVFLNGILISSWKADDRGNFVAKFSMDEVKSLDGLIIGDYNKLQLVGVTNDGEAFVGAQDIKVIDVTAQAQQGP
jgi:hypothetical protein